MGVRPGAEGPSFLSSYGRTQAAPALRPGPRGSQSLSMAPVAERGRMSQLAPGRDTSAVIPN